MCHRRYTHKGSHFKGNHMNVAIECQTHVPYNIYSMGWTLHCECLHILGTFKKLWFFRLMTCFLFVYSFIGKYNLYEGHIVCTLSIYYFPLWLRKFSREFSGWSLGKYLSSLTLVRFCFHPQPRQAINPPPLKHCVLAWNPLPGAGIWTARPVRRTKWLAMFHCTIVGSPESSADTITAHG